MNVYPDVWRMQVLAVFRWGPRACVKLTRLQLHESSLSCAGVCARALSFSRGLSLSALMLTRAYDRVAGVERWLS